MAKKKLTPLQLKYQKEIFTELCDRINVDYATVDFQTTDWQDLYTWSLMQEISFQSWLLDYLKHRPQAVELLYTFQFMNPVDNKSLIDLVKHFTLFYGWAFDETDELSDITENSDTKLSNLYKLIKEQDPNNLGNQNNTN